MFSIPRRYLRIICVCCKHLSRSVSVALEDDNSTILKFCSGSVSRDCSFFEFAIHQSTVIFSSANRNPLVQQSPQSLWDEMSVAAGPGDAQWIRGRENEYSPRLKRSELVHGQYRLLVFKTQSSDFFYSQPQTPLHCAHGKAFQFQLPVSGRLTLTVLQPCLFE